jgi:hypothetical protein
MVDMGTKRALRFELETALRERDEARGQAATSLAMIEKLLAGRDEAKGIVEATLSGIAPLFVGYQTQDGPTKIEQMLNEHDAQTNRQPTMYPDVEFDIGMPEPSDWRTNGWETQGAANGGPAGQQAGATAPQLDSGVESI